MRELAFLNKGITITFIDSSQKKKKTEKFKYEGGVLEFVEYLDTKEKNYLIKMEMIFLKSLSISRVKKKILKLNVL